MCKSLTVFHFMRTVQPENFPAFLHQTANGNVVPVTTTVAADLQTPFGIYLLLRTDNEYSFLLESIEGGANLARFRSSARIRKRLCAGAAV